MPPRTSRPSRSANALEVVEVGWLPLVLVLVLATTAWGWFLRQKSDESTTNRVPREHDGIPVLRDPSPTPEVSTVPVSNTAKVPAEPLETVEEPPAPNPLTAEIQKTPPAHPLPAALTSQPATVAPPAAVREIRGAPPDEPERRVSDWSEPDHSEAPASPEGTAPGASFAPLPPSRRWRATHGLVSRRQGGWRLPPQKRGGRPRVLRGTPLDRPEPDHGSPLLSRRPPQPHGRGVRPFAAHFRLQLEARLVDGRWHLVLDAGRARRHVRGGTLQLLQAGEPLPVDLVRGWCFLAEPDLPVEVVADGRVIRQLTPVASTGYLLFSLGRRNPERARRVRQPGTGLHLLLLAPGWEVGPMDEESPVRWEPGDPPALPGWSAFSVDFGSRRPGRERLLPLRAPDGRLHTVAAEAVFSLRGLRLEDDWPGGPPLFGGSPPELALVGAGSWQEVGTVVVGREGAGPRIRTAFGVDGLHESYPLPPESWGSGWYYVRVYDRDGLLWESFDFRWVPGLKALRWDLRNVWPGAGRHEPVEVRIHHDGRLKVGLRQLRRLFEPASPTISDSGEQAGLELESDDHWITLRLSPKPGLGWVKLPLRVDPGRWLDVRIPTGKIWWAVLRAGGSEGRTPANGHESHELAWSTEPLALTRTDFFRGAQTSVRVLLPPGSVSVQARVEDGPLHPFTAYPLVRHSYGSQPQVEIHLWEFFDDRPFSENLGELRLLVSLRGETWAVPVAAIQPAPAFRCRLGCGFTVDERDALLEHLVNAHRAAFFPQVPYAELRAADARLPDKFYQCSYCGYIAPWKGTDHGVTVIANHVETEHPGLTLKFKSRTDVEAIRRAYDPSFPYLYRCTLCKITYPFHDPQEVGPFWREHLRTSHPQLIEGP